MFNTRYNHMHSPCHPNIRSAKCKSTEVTRQYVPCDIKKTGKQICVGDFSECSQLSCTQKKPERCAQQKHLQISCNKKQTKQNNKKPLWLYSYFYNVQKLAKPWGFIEQTVRHTPHLKTYLPLLLLTGGLVNLAYFNCLIFFYNAFQRFLLK